MTLELSRCAACPEAPDRNRSHLETAFRYSEACVLVYDVMSRDSFTSAEELYTLLCKTMPHLETQRASAPQSRRAGIVAFMDRLLRCRRSEQDSVSTIEPPMPLFVVANKTDNNRFRWAVTENEGMEFSRRIGATFYSVSALTGEGCGEEIQDDIGESIVRRRLTARGYGVPRAKGQLSTVRTRGWNAHLGNAQDASGVCQQRPGI